MSSLGQKSQQLQELLSKKLGHQIAKSELSCGDLVVYVRPEDLITFAQLLKMDSELNFAMLVDVTAIDWLDKKDERYEVVYHLMSLSHQYRLRVKVVLSEGNAQVESLFPLWGGANFLEREVWDMYGIKFINHPDLRRILMYDEFIGHPLRKDYPVQGKQPRVPLISPEVENTARNMNRAALVQIGKRKREGEVAPI